MGKIFRLDRNFEDTVAARKTAEQSDVMADFWYAAKQINKQQNIIEEKRKMSRVLMIGAGGVATVAAFKIVQNADVFTEFMIASRRKAKCDALVEAIHKKGFTMPIKTAQVDADDVEQLKALFAD